MIGVDQFERVGRRQAVRLESRIAAERRPRWWRRSSVAPDPGDLALWKWAVEDWDATQGETHPPPRLATSAHQRMPAQAPFSLTLAASYLAPRIARRTLGCWLGEMSCPPEFVEDATLVVDELVTNVVRHAATAARVVASVDDGLLRQEVHDRSSAPLRFERGRRSGCLGLQLVTTLVDDWRWGRVGAGKYVWAEMRFANPWSSPSLHRE